MLKKIVLVLLIILCGCAAKDNCDDCTLNIESSITSEDNDLDKYVFLDDNPRFKQISFKESFEIARNGSGIIYYGDSGCPVCQRIVPVLNKLANDYDFDVYYVNVYSSDRSDVILDELMNVYDTFLRRDEEGNKHLYLPMVVSVKEGMLRIVEIGIKDTKIIKNQPLSDEDFEKVYNNYYWLYYYVENWE